MNIGMWNYPMLCTNFYIDFKGNHVYGVSCVQYYHLERQKNVPHSFVYNAKGDLVGNRNFRVYTYGRNISARLNEQGAFSFEGVPTSMKFVPAEKVGIITRMFSGMRELVTDEGPVSNEVLWICPQKRNPKDFLVRHVDVALSNTTKEISPFLNIRREIDSIRHNFQRTKSDDFFVRVMKEKIDANSTLPIFDDRKDFIGFLLLNRQESEAVYKGMFFGCAGKELDTNCDLKTICYAPSINVKGKGRYLHIENISYEGSVGSIIQLLSPTL